MAEYIPLLQEIRKEPDDLHIFCPRQGEGENDKFEEDETGVDVVTDSERRQKIEATQARRKKFVKCLRLLAWDGDDVAPFHKQIYELLNRDLKKCELCVRRYYIERRELLNELRQEYQEDDIQSFLTLLDRRDIDRIKDGLDKARESLLAVPEQKRGIAALDTTEVVALFESLHCRAFHEDESLLDKHFDEVFKLAQPKKPLRVPDILPAHTKFLFDSKETRLSWAVWSWNKLPRNATDFEWEYAVKEMLQNKYLQCNDHRSSTKLWSALKVIVRSLDEKQIIYKLFDLNPSISKLALDHLAHPTFGVPQITHTLTEVLDKAANAFWQTMGSISSSTLIEAIFGSTHFDRCLENAVKTPTEPDLGVLQWIPSLLQSLKPANRPAACHTLVFQLLQRVHSEKVSDEAKKICFKMAVKVISYTLSSFSDNESNRRSTTRLVLSDTLRLISAHIHELLCPKESITSEDIRKEVMSIVRNAFALECQCLRADFESLSARRLLGHESSSYSPDIWHAVIRHLSDSDTELSIAAVVGITHLPGLDEIRSRDQAPDKETDEEKRQRQQLVKQRTSYNEIFKKVTSTVGELLAKLSEFKPDHLDHIFRSQQASMPVLACLFSGDQSIYSATIDIIKNISGEVGRKEAISHLLDAFFSNTLSAICWTFRRLSTFHTFASMPRMLKTGMDILEVLCDSQNGILRTKELDEERNYMAVQNYWSYQWVGLRTVFRYTETWSMEVHDKDLMTNVCRDAMQYAGELFKQYHLFQSRLQRARPEKASEIPMALLDPNEENSRGSPPKCLESMSRWLRLRDQYLANTLVSLITEMLARLKEYGSILEDERLKYIVNVAAKSYGESGYIKTILSDQQKAEMVRALESYFGRPIIARAKKQSTLNSWAASGDRSGSSTPLSGAISVDEDEDEFGTSDFADNDLVELSEAHEKIQRAKEIRRKEQPKGVLKPLPSRPIKQPPPSLLSQQARKSEAAKAFIENRKREEAARKQREREAALRLRGKSGVGQQTGEAGSGLSGIGIRGKDHSLGQSNIMVSSDEESDSDSDDELFGGKIKTAQPDGTVVRKPITKGPVRKIKQVRTQKDIRARLTPDLSPLHREILSWDFFADTDTPPSSSKTDYTLVTNTFRTPQDYVKTFEPLLVLEGWQSFRSAREDGNFKAFEVKVSNSLIVDNFFEVNTVISMAQSKELGISVSDVVLLSKASEPESSPDEPHCLARVKEMSRKKGEVQIVYRVNAANNSLRPFLNDKSTVHGIQILSLTPLEREYSALMALEYYDLCDEVVRARPSPLLDYGETELEPIKRIYNVNIAQAKAVKSAIDNDAFTLIQGPPGSGKTKTICAIVGALLTNSQGKHSVNQPRVVGSNGSRPAPPPRKKVLVCAPSNAAVDELVMRFKDGVKSMDGSGEKINVVRLGRSDAINTAVKDVTLEELVNARLKTAAPAEQKEDIHSVMMEHKSVSEELNKHRDHMDQMRGQGKVVPPEDETLFDGLKRKRNALGSKIDDMREKQNSASRDADLNRKRMQQEVLDSAHVLCATLSGSGHEIFQGLNVEFETVIIDEAAQSIELSALIPLKYGCSKCILVGDPKQLPPTVLSREAAKFQYQQSLFARMEGNHKNDVHLLDTQYRMHPEISLFPSRMFYDSRLKDGDGMAKLRARPWHHSTVFAPYRFFDVQGMSHAAAGGHSLINIAELNVALQIYERLTKDVSKYDFKGKIGIITPYKGQLRELKRRFQMKYGEQITTTIEFNTTDAFQGRESEIIIFSCVRASTQGLGFLNDIRRMNVGLTRAKCSLWVLGNSEALAKGEYWRGLINDAKSRDLYTNGDVLKLLSRPQLTEDMMRDDVTMEDQSPAAETKPSVSTSASASPVVKPRSLDKTEARVPSTSEAPKHVSPAIRPKEDLSRQSSASSLAKIKREPSVDSVSAASERRSSGTKQEPNSPRLKHEPKLEPSNTHPGKDGASGGRFGLNDNANCAMCGSGSHFTRNCDNMQAKEASIGRCYRCAEAGHTAVNCSSPRCIGCGTVGHLEDRCTVAIDKRLTKAEREEVKRQEIEFGRAKDRARERRLEKRLGEHGAKIPTIQSTGSPQSTGREHKRKREELTNGGAEVRPPKSTKVSDHPGSDKNSSGRVTDRVGHDTLHPGKEQSRASGPGVGGQTTNGAGSKRGPLVGQPVVKKKRAREDGMFMKRK